ncbi:MAG: hypothetical protein IJ523_06610 [Succinivibrionaceae bacterium]|nr:hypothetical protein [Succinivibrionaceae bacterium]
MKAVKIVGRVLFGLVEAFFLFGAISSKSKGTFIILMLLLAFAYYCIIRAQKQKEADQAALRGEIPDNPPVFCTKNGKTYHSMPNCQYVARFKMYRLTLKQAKRRHMKPCSGCCGSKYR